MAARYLLTRLLVVACHVCYYWIYWICGVVVVVVVEEIGTSYFGSGITTGFGCGIGRYVGIGSGLFSAIGKYVSFGAGRGRVVVGTN